MLKEEGPVAHAWAKAAKDLAETCGWKVFPVHAVIDGECTCGESCGRDAGKHPMTSHGFKDATSDVETIEAWGSNFPYANIGVACAKSGLVVIDVDIPSGYDELDQWKKKLGDLPFTVCSTTGSGGTHFFFAAQPGLKYKGRLDHCVDIRSDAYVVVPPATHRGGTYYEWMISPLDEKPKPLPEGWTEHLAVPERNEASSSTQGHGYKIAIDLQAALTDGKIPPDLPGTQREWLVRLARSLAGTGLPAKVTVSILWALMENSSLRPNDPWTEEDAHAIYRSVALTSAPPMRNDSRDAAPGSFEERVLEKEWDVLRVIEDGIPDYEMLCDGLLFAGKRHLLAAERKSGKSLVSLSLARMLVEDSKKVVYLDRENGVDEIARRCKSLGFLPPPGLFRYFDFPRLLLDDAAQWASWCEREEIELVIFDNQRTMLTANGLEENSNDHLSKWAEASTASLHERGITTLILDNAGWERDRVRGASVKEDLVDVLYTLELVDDFSAHRQGAVRIVPRACRFGTTPDERAYRIGGTPCVFERVDEQEHKKEMAKERRSLLEVAVEVLREAGVRMTSKQLKLAVRDACKDEGIPTAPVEKELIPLLKDAAGSMTWPMLRYQAPEKTGGSAFFWVE